ncbi:MAG: response regulator transcription factor [Verrucomicrobia bacterium]|nr:response regulator transcription factor [Verrucomicrobiota bacterium]
MATRPETDGSRPVRILVVDDHPLFRDAVKATLQRGLPGAVCAEAQSAEEALPLIQREAWDLVLMDVSMPGRSGLDILQDVRAARPRMPVLIVSGNCHSELALRVLRHGAAGFLTKTSAAQELLTAVAKVLQGGRYVSPDLAGEIALALGTGTDTGPLESLSNREREVLRLIAAAKAPKEIAATLHLSAKTVSTYRTRILQKLNLQTTAQLMRFAILHGLVD